MLKITSRNFWTFISIVNLLLGRFMQCVLGGIQFAAMRAVGFEKYGCFDIADITPDATQDERTRFRRCAAIALRRLESNHPTAYLYTKRYVKHIIQMQHISGRNWIYRYMSKSASIDLQRVKITSEEDCVVCLMLYITLNAMQGALENRGISFVINHAKEADSTVYRLAYRLLGSSFYRRANLGTGE